MTTAEQIRAIRAATGLTQQAFGERFGIPRRTIQEWEGGRMSPPPYVIRLLELAVAANPER